MLTLYALNLELARAPLASAEPLIAEMRLQWWIERLEEIGAGAVPSHELLGPLAGAWGAQAAGFAAWPRRAGGMRRASRMRGPMPWWPMCGRRRCPWPCSRPRPWAASLLMLAVK
ncbi:squalene/phytoene synthase family protein [Paracoccus mutanolyticus]|uniref:squalene/phytoene synthase family protein n=1 Tax=Paracoccus mutanolyticus TaxID=1499308 RepID=UPI0021D53429|nr:squalene/phytoene synthase family protein [Paracoccus mutanolyticus]